MLAASMWVSPVHMEYVDWRDSLDTIEKCQIQVKSLPSFPQSHNYNASIVGLYI